MNDKTLALEYAEDLGNLANTVRKIAGVSGPLTVSKMNAALSGMSVKIEDFNYRIENNECAIIAYVGPSTHVVVPAYIEGNPVVRIEDEAFAYGIVGINLESITLPETIESIGEAILANQQLVKTLVIPRSVEDIASFMLSGSYVEILYFTDRPEQLASNALSSDRVMDIYVPWKMGEYDDAPWGAINATIHYSYSSIDDMPPSVALRNTLSRSIVEIYVPEGVTEIGPYAFANCKSLVRVDLPSTIETIASNAFMGCSALEIVNLKGSKRYVWQNRTLVDMMYEHYEGNNPKPKIEPAIIFGNSSKDDMSWIYRDSDGNQFYPTIIADNAYRSTNIVDMYLWQSIKYVGNSAFADCKELTDVDMSSCTMYEVGGSAFSDCPKLKTFEFPKSTSNPSGGVQFWDACFARSFSDVSVANVILDLSYCPMTHVPKGMFANCSKLTEVILPEGIIRIEEAAFKSCGSLTTVVMPSSCKEIGYEAFYYDYALTDVQFGTDACLEIIGDSAFRDCYKLSSFGFPSSLRHIGRDAFRSTSTGLTSIIFSDDSHLSTIAERAFQSLKGVTSVKLPPSLRYIGDYAFDTYNNAEQQKGLSLDLSNTAVEYIGSHAFNNWWYATGILKLPKTIKHIGKNAFKYWNQGSGITRDVYIPIGCTDLDPDAFYQSRNLWFSVPWGKNDRAGLNQLRGDSRWFYNNYKISLDDSALFADEMCAKLKGESYDLHVPDIFETVPEDMCKSDTLVKNVYITKGTTAIGEYAFCQVSNTANKNMVVHIPEGVKSIGKYAFYNYAQISLSLPNSLEEIGSSAFAKSKLSKITVPTRVHMIGSYAFQGISTEPFHIPMSVTEIGAGAFKGCTFNSAASGGLPWIRIHGTPTIAEDALSGVETANNQTLVIYVPWSADENASYGLKTGDAWGYTGPYQVYNDVAGNQ